MLKRLMSKIEYLIVPKGTGQARSSAKRSTFSHKMGLFCKKVKEVRFKKSTFWVQKVHFLGVLHPPKSILATGLRQGQVNKLGLKEAESDILHKN